MLCLIDAKPLLIAWPGVFVAREIRFGEFVREVSANQRAVSYNELTPDPKFDSAGKEIPFRPPRFKLRPSTSTDC